jgi:hypothetical protein
MAQANGRAPRGGSNDGAAFSDTVAAWIADNAGLLDALLTLRGLGEEASQAVDAVLSIRRVTKLRLSLELWMALCEGDGLDPDELLYRRLPFQSLDALKRAIWGSPWDDVADPPSLRIVES